MKLARAVPISVLVFLPVLAMAASICDDENLRRLNTPEASFRSTAELFAVTAPRSKLHIFGEEHFYTDAALLARLTSEIAPLLPGPKKCAFFEAPPGAFARLPQLLQGRLSDPALTAADRQRFLSYYPTIAMASKNARLSVFEIDHPDVAISSTLTEMERDATMVANAHRLLTDGTCDSAVFFVGKAHMAPLELRASIPELISAAGIAPVTYNVRDFIERSAEDAGRQSWLACIASDRVSPAFANSGLGPDTVLMPLLPRGLFEREALWTDFDYSIAR